MPPLIRGDTYCFGVTVRDRAGVIINLTDRIVRLTIRDIEQEVPTEWRDDETAVIAKVNNPVDHADPTSGRTQFILTSLEMEIEPGVYKWDTQYSAPGSPDIKFSMPTTTLTIIEDTTRS